MADDCFAGRTLLGFLIYVPLQRWMTIGLQVRAALPSTMLFTSTLAVYEGYVWHYVRVLAMCCTRVGIQGTCIVSGVCDVQR